MRRIHINKAVKTSSAAVRVKREVTARRRAVASVQRWRLIIILLFSGSSRDGRRHCYNSNEEPVMTSASSLVENLKSVSNTMLERFVRINQIFYLESH